MKLGRVILMSLILMGVTLPSFSDEIHFPFPIHERAFVQDANLCGIILDKEAEDSHGFIDNRGSSFVVYGYKRFSEEQLNILKDVMWRNIRR